MAPPSTLEDTVVDAATTARTLAELDTELRVLRDLEEVARAVRYSGEDTKWSRLRELLLDDALIRDQQGNLRKLIIFTEHRDTLAYLVEQITTLLGSDEAVVAIHGGCAPRGAPRRPGPVHAGRRSRRPGRDRRGR